MCRRRFFPTSAVQVWVLDNDSPGVLTSAAIVTLAENDMATYTVVLNSRPTASVNVSVVTPASTPTNLAVTPSYLLFTTANWNTPQTVTLRGVVDALVEQTQTFVIGVCAAVSSWIPVAGS